jgi:hypothetical protein
MYACSLRRKQYASNNEDPDDRRGNRAAQCHAAVAYRLVEEIADGRAKRPYLATTLSSLMKLYWNSGRRKPPGHS